MTISESLILPLLPMREEVIFPQMTLPFFVGRKSSMEALDKALSGDRQIFVVTQRNPSTENPKQDELFHVGVVGSILQVMRLPNGTVKALFEAKFRAQIIDIVQESNIAIARVKTLPDDEVDVTPQELTALGSETRMLFQNHIKINKTKIRDEVAKSIEIEDELKLADLMAPQLEITREQKQNLLECYNGYHRLEMVREYLKEEVEIKKLEEKLRKQVQEQIRNSQKEGYLQDQLRSIQKELGQIDNSKTEFEEIEQKIKDAQMSKEAEEVAQKELKKLKLMSPMSSEANVVRNYLEWLVALPWSQRTDDDFNLDRAQTILDEDHYGLEKVKSRIIEYLAVANLKGTLKGPIICLVGPPGVGKTSLAKSIARALNRNFVRMSLGGVRDEAEIRGHRRTYIGALPGKIIQSIRKAKSTNPLLLMDEVDKLYQSAMSDPSAALLEVLDPEQNDTFMDHYLEVEYNLSDVLFLCTANSTEHIPGPLLDRMEVIKLSGYTEIEKHHIATKFLIPKQCEVHGLSDQQLQFRKNAISDIIQGYTREAGVRSLERQLGKVCRKVVTQLVRSKEEKKHDSDPQTGQKTAWCASP